MSVSLKPESALTFKSDQPHHLTFNQQKPVNPWVLFFTALAAVALGKVFDLAVAAAIWWYYVQPLIEATK